MAVAKLIQTFSLSDGTINQSVEPQKLAPNEFSELFGFIVEKGSVGSVPSLKYFKYDPAISPIVYPGAVLGLYSLNWGPNGQWLIAAIAQRDFKNVGPRLYAFLIDWTQKGTQTIRRVVYSNRAHCVGLEFNFFEYRNKLFASNGFETFCFNGEEWTGPNNKYYGGGEPDEWQQLGKEISFICGAEYFERPVLCGTPTYPNEITFGDVRVDIDEKTTWAGISPAGGIPVSFPLNTVYFFNELVGVVGGEGGVLLRTVNGGKTWERVGSETVAIRGLCFDGEYLWYAGGMERVKYPIRRSVDEGRTWELPPSPPPVAINYYAVSADGAGKIIVGGGISTTGYGYCVYTEDGGVSWVVWGSNNAHKAGAIRDIGIIKWYTGIEGQKEFLAPCANRENFPTKVLWYTYLQGGTSVVTALVVDDAFKKNFNGIGVKVDGNNRKVLVIGDEGGIWKTDDYTIPGGWFKISVEGLGAINLNAIARHPTNASTFYVVGDAGTIIKTTNGGDSWDILKNTGISVNLRDIQILYDSVLGSITIIVCGDNGAFYYSTDGGATWEKCPTIEEVNKFSDSVFTGDHEQNRAILKAHGRLYVGTSRDLYVYDPQFARLLVCPGLSVLNSRCMVEYANSIWVLGHYNNMPGLWVWQGEGSPILASRRIQNLISEAIFEPAPKFVDFILDTESDWQPRACGITYSQSLKWHKGFLKLPPDGSEYKIYSHGDGVSESIKTTGFYLGDCAIHTGIGGSFTRASDFGYLGIVIAFNSPDEYKLLQKCDIQIRIAPSLKDSEGREIVPARPDESKWTDWVSVVPGGNLPQTGQGTVPGSYWLRITAAGGKNGENNYFQNREPYKWVQFQIIGKNAPESNWALARVILRCLVRATNAENVIQPSLLVWDNKLWGFLNNGGFVVSNDGGSISLHPYNDIKVNASTVHLGRLILGSRIVNTGTRARIFYNSQDASANECPFVTCFTTGRFGNEGQYAGHKKILRRIRINACAQGGNETHCLLRWWADGRRDDCAGEKKLVFHSVHNPTEGFYQTRVIECPGPTIPQAGTYGNDFTLQIRTYEPHLRILGLQAEYDVAVPEPKETDFGSSGGELWATPV